MKKSLIVVLATILIVLFSSLASISNAQTNTLYGLIVDKTTTPFTTYLVTIDETTGAASNYIMLSDDGDADLNLGALAYDPVNQILYTLADRTTKGDDPKLATIDICTGEVNIVGTITVNIVAPYFGEGLAVDPSGVIYASMSLNNDVGTYGDYESETLVTINPTTAVATVVAKITGTQPYTGGSDSEADGLEFVGTTLYATDDDGNGPTDIFTINTGTGVATWKNELYSPRFNNVNDMAYNSLTNHLYGFDPGAYENGNPRKLCTISTPDTAVATPIGEIHSEPYTQKSVSGIAWADYECCPPLVTDLYTGAGNNDITNGMNVGNVEIWNDDTNLYVNYNVTGVGCYLTEVHLYVGQSLPSKVAPGQFPYKPLIMDYPTEWPFIIPLSDLGAICDDQLYLAAHATVCCDDSISVICETAWGFGERSFDYLEISKKWGWIIDYPICCN